MQKLRYSKYLKFIVVLMDIFAFAAILFYFYNHHGDFNNTFDSWKKIILINVIFTTFWLLLSGKTRLYSVPRSLTYTNYLERILSHNFLFIFGILVIAQVLDTEFIKVNPVFISFFILLIIGFLKSMFYFTLKYIRTKGINHRNVMFLGSGTSLNLLKDIFEERKDYGYKIFDFNDENDSIQALRNFWVKNGIHTLFISSENELNKSFERAVFDEAEKYKVAINIIPDINQNDFFTYELGYVETQPILTPIKFPLDFTSNYLIKRLFDVVFSLLFLILIGSWLFPVIAILVKSSSKGPILFKQQRYGYNDEVFNVLKFRTMYVNDLSSTKTTEKNDERITPLGKFLRRTSLDETPQFINVLLGEMSVVGPRPHMLLVDDYYKRKIDRYTLRSKVKPGVTGLSQVNGLRGDKDDMELEMKKRILSDSFYVKNWSFSLDLIIILKTLILLVEGDKNAQ